MAVTLFGNTLDTFLEQPESGSMTFNAEGIMTVTRVWKATYASGIANAPSVRTLDPGGTGALCVDVKVDSIEPGWAIITAQYQGFIYLPFPIYEFNNSRMERPITMNAGFKDITDDYKVFDKVTDPNTGAVIGKQFAKFQDSSPTVGFNKFAGIESFIVGNAQWRKTSYATTPDFDQTDVGKLNAPETGTFTGLPDQSNADKKWLKVEKTCRNLYRGASLLWEIQEVWQYNDLGWQEEFYDV